MIHRLSAIFGEIFSNPDSFMKFLEYFAEIKSNIFTLNKTAPFLFQHQNSLPQQIQSLTAHILNYFNQFSNQKFQKFNQLYQLFGIGVKPEFPLSPNSFVSFVDSISEKIIQLQDKANRYERELKSLKEIIERERTTHSNSLLVLNLQDERRISLIKQTFEK
jgi:hypothetical protein